ncbi:MAG: DUF4870 domain-containing protein [Dehalococcoidia bacterium]
MSFIGRGDCLDGTELVVLGVLDLIFCIMAAVKASRGELWKYPLSIPFLKARPDSTGTVVQ